jgi:hypothetical protein
VLVFLYRVYYAFAAPTRLTVYRVHHAFAAPTRLTVYRNLQTQYGLYTDNFPSLYTSKNPIATDPASLLTSHTINTSHGGLVSKAREQGLVA